MSHLRKSSEIQRRNGLYDSDMTADMRKSDNCNEMSMNYPKIMEHQSTARSTQPMMMSSYDGYPPQVVSSCHQPLSNPYHQSPRQFNKSYNGDMTSIMQQSALNAYNSRGNQCGCHQSRQVMNSQNASVNMFYQQNQRNHAQSYNNYQLQNQNHSMPQFSQHYSDEADIVLSNRDDTRQGNDYCGKIQFSFSFQLT